jgi:uncharacterized protein (UPF0335 family)
LVKFLFFNSPSFQATEHLRAFIEDCDRRTELAKKRLAETQEELSAEVSSKAEKVHELSETIGKKLAQAEQAGAEGKLETEVYFWPYLKNSVKSFDSCSSSSDLTIFS